MEEVVLVDSKDNVRGTMEKLEAHRKGALHRAFSVLLFNKKGEVMLQQRAADKYHSGSLWSNTCCSHPKPHESNAHAVSRRLKEEMGLNADTQPLYQFIYKYEFDSSLIEHELDHVYIGETSKKPQLNHEEASDWRWMGWKDLTTDMKDHEDQYTFWFKHIINHFNQNPHILPKQFRPKR